jgi:hypothetical protein
LAILAMLVQATPLRACAVVKEFTGTNCHEHAEDQQSSSERPVDNHGPCDRGPSCQCQLPRIDADTAKNAPMPDLLPPLLVTVCVADKPDADSLGAVAAPARLPDIPHSVRLPLLN